MNTYYIFDRNHRKLAYIDKINTCDVAAKLRLFHGPIFTEDDIRVIWNHKTISPSYFRIRRKIRVKNIKWYINTHTDEIMKDSEWHPDFLIGMLQWGKIYYSSVNFPSFWWYGNKYILEYIKSSPFAGVVNVECFKPRDRFIWSDVPALCFKYSKDSVEYMAGVLSTGIYNFNKDNSLIRYNPKIGRIISQYGIPIEHRTKRWVYISPFWPIVLQNYMPTMIKNRWSEISFNEAYRASEYSCILWKIYTGKDPVSKKMPYLLSRRMIFYKYGSMRALRHLWIKNQLVNLDIRFKKVVQDWQKNV